MSRHKEKDDELRITDGGPSDVGEGGGQTKPTVPDAPPGYKNVVVLPADRQGQGEVVAIPEGEFGFAVTIQDVLYVHVSDRADGLYEYIPFSAK